MKAKRALFFAGIFWGVPAAVMVLCKVWKVFRVAEGVPSLSSIYSVLREDLLLAVGGFIVISAILRILSGVFLELFLFILFIFSTFILLLVVLEHGFFLKTGSLGDWLLVKFGLNRIKDPGFLALFWSQVRSVVPLFLGVIAFAVSPFFLERLRGVRRRLAAYPRNRVESYPRLGLAVLVALLFLLIPPSVEGTDGKLKMLRPNIAFKFFKDMVLDLSGGNGRDPFRELAEREGLLFDTFNLRGVKGDDSRLMNVVLIVLESTRVKSITPYNPNISTTPFLAELARRSLVVERAYAVMTHTSKALVPIICGIPPKVTINIVEGEHGGIPGRCLPAILGQLGYQTAFFQPATVRFEGRAQLVDNMGYQLLRGHEDFDKEGFAKTNYFGYEDRIALKPMLRWLDLAIASGKPFFLTYLSLVSHHTYTTPPDFPKRRYTDSLDPELNNYLNALHYIDLFLRDLFKEFEKRGLYKNTLFILVADHGEAFSEHSRRQHDNIMWEEGVRVPLMIFQPELFPKGGIIKGWRSQLDILPTVAEILRIRLKGGIYPGRSLLKPVPEDRQFFFACWYELQCLATLKNGMKVIYHYHHLPTEVYDIIADPEEKNSLAARLPRDWIRRREEEMLLWRERVNAVYEFHSRIKIDRAKALAEPEVQVRVDVKIGIYIRVVGYTLHSRELRPGDSLDITVVYQALKPIPKKWRLFTHLELLKPYRFINADHVPVGGSYPLHRWEPREYVKDQFQIRLPGNYPPGGKVRLYVGVWAPGEGRLPIEGKPGTFKTDGKRRLLLGEFRLVKGN